EQDPAKLADGGEAPPSWIPTARYSDIDVNGHVNSARYVAWLMDAYPVEFHLSHEVRLLELNYLGETLRSDRISISGPDGCRAEQFHSMRKEEGEEVCRARVIWATTSD